MTRSAKLFKAGAKSVRAFPPIKNGARAKHAALGPGSSVEDSPLYAIQAFVDGAEGVADDRAEDH